MDDSISAEEMVQELALKLDLANMELATIDNVLARRPALDGLKHRTEKIERACQVAADTDKALCAIAYKAQIQIPPNIEIQRMAEKALDELRGGQNGRD
jgi:hypothetical protein